LRPKGFDSPPIFEQLHRNILSLAARARFVPLFRVLILSTTSTRIIRQPQWRQGPDLLEYWSELDGAWEQIMNIMCHIVTTAVNKKVTLWHWKLFQNVA
jgi:hypothetical protein